MKLLLVGDVHLRASSPSKRVDDFPAVQEAKLSEVFEIGKEFEAPILFTGDLFDSPSPPLSLLAKYIPKFFDYPHDIFTVPGNHDIYGASLSTVPRSGLGVLEAAGAVKILGHASTRLGDFNLFGHSYMHDERPTPISGEKNILVSHEMVLVDKIWREQEDYIFVDDYLVLHSGWDLILCGHYHYSFEKKTGSRWVVNPGALVRIKASKGDKALRPGVLIYDTEAKTVVRQELSFEPAEKVFANEVSQPKVEDSVDKIVSSLEGEIVSGTFSETLVKALDGCRGSVKDLILSYAEECGYE